MKKSPLRDREDPVRIARNWARGIYLSALADGSQHIPHGPQPTAHSSVTCLL